MSSRSAQSEIRIRGNRLRTQTKTLHPLLNQALNDNAVMTKDVSQAFCSRWCPFTYRRDFPFPRSAGQVRTFLCNFLELCYLFVSQHTDTTLARHTRTFSVTSSTEDTADGQSENSACLPAEHPVTIQLAHPPSHRSPSCFCSWTT